MTAVFSWQMAEELAAAHLRSIGFTDARRTPAGVDAGIDVKSVHAVAQVKFQTAPVGGPTIQQLRGAAHGVEHAIFYASGGYTTAAIVAAETGNVTLFAFTESNEVSPVNGRASSLVEPAARGRMSRWRAMGERITACGGALATAAKASLLIDDRITGTQLEAEDLTARGKSLSPAHTAAVESGQRARRELAAFDRAVEASNPVICALVDAVAAVSDAAHADGPGPDDEALDRLERAVERAEAAAAEVERERSRIGGGQSALLLGDAYSTVASLAAVEG